MAQPLNTSTYKLTNNISVNKKLRVKEIEFGDGYRNVTIDGQNYNIEEWNLEFFPIDSTSAATLETLLVNSLNGTANYLSWTPPGESTTKYWTANNIAKRLIDQNFWQITCVLRREYILA
jgi:phage-related protein